MGLEAIRKAMRAKACLKRCAFATMLMMAPGSASAKDVTIDVSTIIRQERVRPSPKIVTPTIRQTFVVREDGTVGYHLVTSGAHPINKKLDSRLGKMLKVIDQRTIRQSWQNGGQTRTLTITIDGSECKSTLLIENGAAEFTAFSTDLGTDALYRNSSTVSSTCRIE